GAGAEPQNELRNPRRGSLPPQPPSPQWQDGANILHAACNWFDTKSFPRNSTSCGAFCQLKSDSVNRAFLRCSVRTGFLPIELSPTGQQWESAELCLRSGILLDAGPRSPQQEPPRCSAAAASPRQPPAARSRGDRISQLFVTNPGNCPHLPTPVAGGNAADAIACRARGSPCARQETTGTARAACGLCAAARASAAFSVSAPTPSAPLLRRPGSDGGVLLNPSKPPDGHRDRLEPLPPLHRLRGPGPGRVPDAARFDAVSMATRQWRDLAVTSQTSLLIEELSAGPGTSSGWPPVNSAGFSRLLRGLDPVKTGDRWRRAAPRGLREVPREFAASGWAADVQILWRPAPDRKQPDEL
uniref:Sushi domain-containing protein n=1 Tax=Macrostomum lignano TaxID=282301 RepID=A0A1I8FCX4_9PLAT